MHQTKRILLVVVGSLLFVTGLSQPAVAKKAKNPVSTVMLILNPKDSAAFTRYAYDTVTPNTANFHQYLTPNQIANKFGRSEGEIERLRSYFKKYHLATTTFSGRLTIKVAGHYQNLKRAFHAQALTRSAAKGALKGTDTKLPKSLAKLVTAVIGMDVKATYQAKQASKSKQGAFKTAFTRSMTRPDLDESTSKFSKAYGSAKYADRYGLTKLYAQGNKGQGQRVGLIVFANYRLGDIKKYLAADGQNTDLSRIHKYFTVDHRKKVMAYSQRVDGYTFALQEETTLDVQQAASVAPEAQIDTYIPVAVNGATDELSLMVNNYAAAIAANRDRQLSTSFAIGSEHDGFDDIPATSVSPAAFNRAMNVIYRQATVQGISLFAASGDNGPYNDVAKPICDFPVSTSPFLTEIGGTTLPYTKIVNDKLVRVPTERSWGDTYSLSKSERNNGQFGGSGGGFSILNSTPPFQQGVSGVNTFNAVTELSYNPKKKHYVLNSHPKRLSGESNGRNLPDFSTNADRNTGYAVYLTGTMLNNAKQKLWQIGGGTSFAAPQAAAASAVLNSGLTTPIGFWNPQIYQFAQQTTTPFKVLDSPTDNNNLYYTGQPGKRYNQASGLGTVNYQKLLTAFQRVDQPIR
ncbi:protease pro-enzyme activation domain-containing protein [Lentilactobacillus raoultii]|uniref:Protease pro-enzyme activation domain-containing protein n=1 Tax=Lentilactobacillus raoultii TaxID=1987503 RepID=A0ABW3PDX4_9LACO|nr:protease pro-enzyme activation domain-containing protein [Lentilactobacillus raoultii]